MYKLVKDCKSAQEAIDRSGLQVGQLVCIDKLVATGNVDGTWTVHASTHLPDNEEEDDRNPYLHRERMRQAEASADKG